MIPPSSPGTLQGTHQRSRTGYVLARALLFVPALGLLAFTLWKRAEVPPVPTALDEPSVPMRTGEVASINGWEGLVPREGAAPLRLRLEPLHPEARRQAFDAQALRVALRPAEEGPGPQSQDQAEASEPWRLTLSVAARPGSAAARATVIESLGGVRVDGLEPIVPPHSGSSETDANDDPADPLDALMQFTDAPLRGGESCDLVFWGPRPEGPVRATVPGIGDVELLSKVRAAGRSTVSIARLDARSQGPEAEGTDKGSRR